MATLVRGTNFPAVLATEMFSLVKGHSSLAKMAGAEPIPFAGKDVFTFNFASDVSVVGEGAAKPAGDATVTPVQIRPIKVVYQSRVSDEFVNASEEAQLEYLKAFADGFAKKLAAGLDKMAMHGVNPATGSASNVIGTNHLDAVIQSGNTIDISDENVDADVALEMAIDKIEEANGVILSPSMRSDIATLTGANGRKYPEFAWGATPADMGGMAVDTNSTVGTVKAYVGNFEAFKWGFAKEMPLEVIEYGDPDGTGHDLKQYNEVCLRSEAYIGWGFMSAAEFAKVVA